MCKFNLNAQGDRYYKLYKPTMNTLKSAKYTSIKRFATFGPSPL